MKFAFTLGRALNTSKWGHTGGILFSCQNQFSLLLLTQRSSGSICSSLLDDQSPYPISNALIPLGTFSVSTRFCFDLSTASYPTGSISIVEHHACLKRAAAQLSEPQALSRMPAVSTSAKHNARGLKLLDPGQLFPSLTFCVFYALVFTEVLCRGSARLS